MAPTIQYGILSRLLDSVHARLYLGVCWVGVVCCQIAAAPVMVASNEQLVREDDTDAKDENVSAFRVGQRVQVTASLLLCLAFFLFCFSLSLYMSPSFVSSLSAPFCFFSQPV